MEEQFINLFRETLEHCDQEINPGTKFRDLENWDSLAFLSVIAMIDDEYDVVIEGNDFQKLITIQDLVDEIQKRKT